LPMDCRKTASIRAFRRSGRPVLAAGAVLLAAALAGCQRPNMAPPVDVTLAGAQVPAELIESWLHDAPSHCFSVKKLWPMRYAGDGFDRLAAGACDLACTDRPMNGREVGAFGDRPVVGRRVAFYGYALYVHPSNRLDAIFAKHLEMVLQGQIKDWHELAGDAIPELTGPINIYGLSKSTRAGMQLSQMARIWFSNPTWTVCGTDAEIIAKVAADPLALGFAGIGYDGQGVRYLGLRMHRAEKPAFPSLEAIETEQYGLAKVLYVYHVEPADAAVQAVLDYLYSDDGRAAMESTDVWQIPRARGVVPAVQ
jgi:ABC-type phosphate transport system substrate-binding protein